MTEFMWEAQFCNNVFLSSSLYHSLPPCACSPIAIREWRCLLPISKGYTKEKAATLFSVSRIVVDDWPWRWWVKRRRRKLRRGRLTVTDRREALLPWCPHHCWQHTVVNLVHLLFLFLRGMERYNGGSSKPLWTRTEDWVLYRRGGFFDYLSIFCFTFYIAYFVFSVSVPFFLHFHLFSSCCSIHNVLILLFLLFILNLKDFISYLSFPPSSSFIVHSVTPFRPSLFSSYYS